MTSAVRFRRRLWPLVVLGTALGRIAAAQEPAVEKEFVPSEEFQTFVTQLVRDHLPHQYERKKNWGTTRRVWNGVDVGLDGLRLDTKQKWKERNHGVWQIYNISQIDPEKNLAVRIEKVQEQDGGKVACDVTAAGKLHCYGKQVHWDRGVQLYAIVAECEATVRVRTHTVIMPRLDASVFPPDILLITRVERADIDLLDFRLLRVGELDGPVIRSLSASVREIVEDRLSADHDKIVQKINVQLEKQQEKLRLKFSDLSKTPWGTLAEKLLGG